jgi:cyclophilin family peptidyl-prolyl cis-trans isomerase
MKRLITSLAIASLIVALPTEVTIAQEPQVNPQMVLDTTQGVIIIELFEDKAPISVANIIQYAEEGFYNGTIFHRIIDRFMIQGGGFGQDMVKKEVRDGIQNESDNGLSNVRGTVALARTSDPHSATAQFFISTVNNENLDHKSKTGKDGVAGVPDSGWGYAVFGQVVEGMTTVDRISRVRTRTHSGMQNVPLLPVVIERATIRRPEAPAADGE